MGFFKPNVQKMKEKKDVSGLIKALDDKDSIVRCAAAEALGQIGDPQAVEPLKTMLKFPSHEEWSVQQAAILALGDIGDSRSAEAIVAWYLHHLGEWELAARALKKAGNQQAVDYLVHSLGQMVGGVTHGYASAWYSARDDFFSASESSYLDRAAKDFDEVVEALRHFGDARAVSPLIGAIEELSRLTPVDLAKKALAQIVERVVGDVEASDLRKMIGLGLGAQVEQLVQQELARRGQGT